MEGCEHLDEKVLSVDAHGLDADSDAAAVLVLAAEVEAAIVHVPEREPEWCDRVEILPAELLHAEAIDLAARLVELRQRRAVPEDVGLLVLPERTGDVREERDLPAQVISLLRPMPETELHPARGLALRRAEGSVAQQASADHVPL